MKAILVDDEQLALDFLENKLEKVGGIEIIGKFNNLNFRKDKSLLIEVDVLFLDIDMPEMSGLELAEWFLETDPSLSIVFVTAFNEYAVQAFALNALDYLLKPVQVERLKQTVERIRKNKDHPAEVSGLKGQTLRINMCNELTFQTPDNTARALKWRTAKAQELFLYLLQYSERIVQKAELVELLWPDFGEERAFPQLYTAIYHIRKILEPFHDYIGINNNHGGYRLWTNNISLDIVLWENRIKTSPLVSVETIDDYEEYMQLYTGPYLGAYHYPWAEAEQHRLEQIWIKTAYQMAVVYEKSNQHDQAAEWYVRICSLRPEDEDSNFALMQVYATLGLGILVNYQYKQLKSAMGDLELEISAHITDWYVGWQAQTTI